MKFLLATVFTSVFLAGFSPAAFGLAPIACYQKAYPASGLNLSEKNAAVLCKGAEGLAPISCFRKAYAVNGLGLTADNAAVLCQGAKNLAPIFVL